MVLQLPSVGGSLWTQSVWTIVLELMQFDVDAAAIAKVVEVLMGFYSADVPPPLLICFCLLVVMQVLFRW